MYIDHLPLVQFQIQDFCRSWAITWRKTASVSQQPN